MTPKLILFGKHLPLKVFVNQVPWVTRSGFCQTLISKRAQTPIATQLIWAKLKRFVLSRLTNWRLLLSISNQEMRSLQKSSLFLVVHKVQLPNQFLVHNQLPALLNMFWRAAQVNKQKLELNWLKIKEMHRLRSQSNGQNLRLTAVVTSISKLCGLRTIIVLTKINLSHLPILTLVIVWILVMIIKWAAQ